VRPDDFFLQSEAETDPIFGIPVGPTRALRGDLLEAVRRGPIANHVDAEVAAALASLVHDDLEQFGTGGSGELNEQEMRDALRALKAVVRRLGISDFDPPFRDFKTFYGWWVRKGAKGSYQARRELLASVFDPLHAQLESLEQRALESSLVNPVSPHSRTGWRGVDAEVTELRRHFMSAHTSQDYRNVGLDCVAVTEALSREVYVASRHLREGEAEPPVANTKQRLERFVEDAAPHPSDAALRRLARASIEFAQHVKHSSTPTRRDAGIAADAVIQLANLLRRLDDSA
jgi:hypothetical protein